MAQELQVVEAQAQHDDSHLIVVLSQETYDEVMEVVNRASERGLVDTFDYWLAQSVKTGAQAKLRTWNDRDIVTLFNTAQNEKLSQSARAVAAVKIQKRLKLLNAT